MPELYRIIGGALRLDTAKVRNYTAFLADKLEKEGDGSSAARLRKLLAETDHQLRPVTLTQVPATIPVDSESRFPLLERVDPQREPEPPVVLTDSEWETVREFLSVAKSHAQLESAGIHGSALSLLMYGPPGCGKSRLARHVAAELGHPLYVARLDGLVSSFLGSTAKNIRAVFEFASRTPGVLFLDEFDAIAKLRGDTHELGELKRVVNSFIQNLDQLGAQTIVLAATNHESLLDSAVWRRFSYRLHLSYPRSALRAELLAHFLPPVELPPREVEALVDLTDGFSAADLREVSLRLHRLRVTTDAPPTAADALKAVLNITLGEGSERRFASSLVALDAAGLARALRARSSNLYSFAVLGSLLGVSKATAQRLGNAEEPQHAG